MRQHKRGRTAAALPPPATASREARGRGRGRPKPKPKSPPLAFALLTACGLCGKGKSNKQQATRDKRQEQEAR